MSDDGLQNFCTFGEMIIPLLQSRDSTSPPKAQVDEASLQKAMDKNKESLKVKLMTRRPITQLVDQGIMPSLKITPQFHHQRQKLERAKMGDYLKNKIQRRPDRQELIQQHILEDTTVDPSLQDKQRQLKKARLADDLNDRLSHRPGPLELVKGNILQADEKFAQAVKEGQIQFKRTCEGQSVRHPPPSFAFEEDSGSDVTLSPPQDTVDQSLSNLPSVDSMVSSPYPSQDSPVSQVELKPTVVSPIAISVPSPVSSQSCSFSPIESVQKESSPNILRVRKKTKPKAQPKPRTIKFHEYKGPPSAQKNQMSALLSETSYELLLKQQQLFLQWQLEWQQKYPQMILPVPQKSPLEQSQGGNSGGNSGKEQSPDLSLLTKCWSKLEDLKVSDLKAELKKRNLPVSGSKPLLIERLKPYSDFAFSTLNKKMVANDQAIAPNDNKASIPISISGIMLDTRPTLTAKSEPVASVVTMDTSTPRVTLSDNGSLLVYNTVPMQGSIVTTSRPSSTAPMDVEVSSPASENQDDCTTNEDIVKMQQKKIQELQRELQKSQLQLQHQQWLQQQQQQQALLATQPVPIATLPVQRIATVNPIVTSTSQTNNVDTKALQKLQQHLHQKLQQQQLLQQLQQQGNSNAMFPANSAAVSAAVKANLAAFIHNNQQQNANNARLAVASQQTLPQLSSFQPIVLCHTAPYNNSSEKPRANSVPNGLGQQRLLWTHSMPNFSAIITAKPVENVNAKFITKLPPDYNEATKQLSTKTKQENKTSGKQRSSRKSVKSQAVDDVLEILIKNGELPPSAAQEPATPTTPETPKSNTKSAPSFSRTITTTPAVPPPPPPPPPPSLPVSSASTASSRHNVILPQSSLPSSVLQTAEPQLNFDFHLEMQDIEAMDLGVLDAPTQDMSCDSHCDSPAKDFSNSGDSFHPHDSLSNLSSSNPSTTSRPMDVDLEFSDWLEVLTSSPSQGNQPDIGNASMLYNRSGDPVMPSISNGHGAFDMFSLDDMDFRPPSSELNLLGWDKLDFAA